MRVLMFGWEFSASYFRWIRYCSFGLTKGMATLDDLEVIFCVPKAWGDEIRIWRLVGANQVQVAYKEVFV